MVHVSVVSRPHRRLRARDNLFPTIPIVESVFDIITLTLISCLILLSILSVCFIFHLRIKSRQSYPLQNFNSLWSIRLVLVAFVACWAINETLRLPLFHRQYLYPLMPAMDILQQASICRIHVVLSLGFFEPGFLITLLFLVNVSIKERNPRVSWSIPLILLSCLPIVLLQTLVVFFSPLGEVFPAGFQVTSVASIDETFHDESVMCTYPLFSIMVFAAFGIAYSLWLLFAYWRVITFVINKGTLTRIHILVFVIIVSLPLQVFFLTFSSFWLPEDAKHGGALLGMFVTVAICVAVGEGILVIKPISDALAASGACCAYNPADAGLRRISNMWRWCIVIVNNEPGAVHDSVIRGLHGPFALPPRTIWLNRGTHACTYSKEDYQEALASCTTMASPFLEVIL